MYTSMYTYGKTPHFGANPTNRSNTMDIPSTEQLIEAYRSASPEAKDEAFICMIRHTPHHIYIKALELTLADYPPESAEGVRACLEATRDVSAEEWDAFRMESNAATA